MPGVGERLHDRYLLTEQIAAGGMGQVWRGTDEVLGRTVAVKVLGGRVTTDRSSCERFRTEARAMAALHHPGVAQVYDYGEAAEPDGSTVAYIVMACVDGQPLSDRIAERGRLTAAETMAVVAQTADALQAVHDAGVVHRDVKPSNLILEPDGHVVLIDFGVAMTPDAPDLTGVREVVGTALYMAPEQVSKGLLTPATDCYALGAVAYHCLAGHPPFHGDNPVAMALKHFDEQPPPLPADVPADVRALVATAMAKDPARRFPEAAAVAAAARAATAFDPDATILLAAAIPSAAADAPAATHMAAGSPALPEREEHPRRKRRTALLAALAGLAALAATLALADQTGSLPNLFDTPPGVAPSTAPSGETGTGTGGTAGDGTSVPGLTPAAGNHGTQTPGQVGTSGGPGTTPQPAASSRQPGQDGQPGTTAPTPGPTAGATSGATAGPIAGGTDNSTSGPTSGATAGPIAGRTDNSSAKPEPTTANPGS
jgi:serine/threonine-protein kinase